MIVKIVKLKNGDEMKVVLPTCKTCKYYIPFNDASGYGNCQANHTFSGAFKETDYCSYAKEK